MTVHSAAPSLQAESMMEELFFNNDTFKGKRVREKSPRLLTTTDIDWASTAPFPLLAPTGDFDKNNTEDMALSGIYNLPGNGPRYFLLVGTLVLNPRRHQLLYFQEFDRPIFLHSSGTTGEGDPGDQAFSLSSCLECEQGVDYYWDPIKRTFFTKPWTAQYKRKTVVQTVPAPSVPMETVEKALKIAGGLKEVQDFVAKSNKQGKKFATRVKPVGKPELKNQVIVEIFTKEGEKEILFKALTVDIDAGKVIPRSRK